MRSSYVRTVVIISMYFDRLPGRHPLMSAVKRVVALNMTEYVDRGRTDMLHNGILAAGKKTMG